MFAREHGSLACSQSLGIALDMCHIFGVPVGAEKMEGPSTCIAYLGILIDIVKGEIRLSKNKFVRLLAELDTPGMAKRLVPMGALIPH